MMVLDSELSAPKLGPKVDDLFRVGRAAVALLRDSWNPGDGTPVLTEKGIYTTRGWTEWTQGFQYGSALILFDALGDEELLTYGRDQTVSQMAPHLSHMGVHDHGFNNVSTYGTLLRLMHEGKIGADTWERRYNQLALRLSGAAQAYRWTDLPGGLGYVYSFNGAHSLFADTIRSMRAVAISHLLGHVLMGEQDRRISLLGRLLAHAETTARYNVYFGEGRDDFDAAGRVAHESIFNVNSGSYRCASSQQGYSPFSTWTRGHAWILCGYPELLEFLDTVTDNQFAESGYAAQSSLDAVRNRFLEVSRAVAEFYISEMPSDGIPYWDTGAPGLAKLGDYRQRPAEPYNHHEPVDSSAAAIAAQGLLRLGDYLLRRATQAEQDAKPTDGRRRDGEACDREAGERYIQAGLTIADTLLAEPYLAVDPSHQGILLHSICHRPNGWDYVHPGQSIPNGESCMWGDYHALELGLCIQRLGVGLPMQRFFDIGEGEGE